MKIRKGDQVQVVAGDNSGKRPRRVIQVLSDGRRLVIEGVNRVYKHVRRGHPKSPSGGRLQLEMPIDSSNCMLYCDTCSRGVRVGLRYAADGRKERFCKRCTSALGDVSRAKARYAKS
jgi:large subunit ribosomal protein L24